MSVEQQYAYTIEQDPNIPPAGNELPTYDDLAQQNGPNSRFGRWKGWIEKRAAERYADVTPEERARRRERGWGESIHDSQPTEPTLDEDISNLSLQSPYVKQSAPQHPSVNHHRPHPAPLPLHVQTTDLSIRLPSPHSTDDTSTLNVPLFASQIVPPTHLKICHFGSRFLPHTTSKIRCILPLLADRMILIGHDGGLSVLDMFPQESAYRGELVTKGPSEAQCRPIWKGESVLQMSMLEAEDIGNGTPQGVILAVVCPSHDSPAFNRDYENVRTVRMYNLASLIGLARWTIANESAKPIDLPKTAGQSPPSLSNRRHRPQSSIARSIKSLIDSPSQISSYQPNLPNSSTNSIGTQNSHSPEKPLIPLRREPDDSEWDIVDDQSIRWATDYKPLASPGSRLAGTSALLFATWSDEGRKGGEKLLAIATKSNILLYETPKGERAYKFVKEFYTPFQTRSLAFIQQTIPDSTPRPYPETISGRFNHKRSNSGSTLRGSFSNPTLNTSTSYGTHLCLFVVFDKKAVWIRLADSVVGEVEFADDEEAPPSATHLFSRISTVSTATLRTRARLSLDIRESLSRWLVPVRCELPVPGQNDTLRPVYILTRGKRTHIVTCPFSIRSPPTPPLYAFFWKSNPKYISPRVIHANKTDEINNNKPPLLQLVAFTDNGIEVQESTLTFLRNKGKGRAMPDDLIKGEEDIGGDTGFLAAGGNWDQLDNLYYQQSMVDDNMDSSDLIARMRRDQGIYGWCRKGFGDWRVFWVGGDRSQDTAHDDDFGV